MKGLAMDHTGVEVGGWQVWVMGVALCFILFENLFFFSSFGMA